ncbi:MAG: hypothetical protein OHK0019_33870 [Saprospiraceae bacterium]
MSLIEFEEEKRQSFQGRNKLDGFILVSYWSDSKSKIDFTVNNSENENLKDILEFKIGENYIVKYSYGANLRAYLPPKDDYSYKTIHETALIQNLSQGTKIKLIDPLIRYSYTDYWARVQVV